MEMNSLMDLGGGVGIFGTLLIGAVAGWIAEKLTGSNMGLIMNIVLGIAGAVVGNYVLRLLNIGLGGLLGQLIVAVAGACILILAYRAFQGRSA